MVGYVNGDNVGWEQFHTAQIRTFDEVHFNPHSILSSSIAKFTRSRGEARTWSRHSGVMYDERQVSESTYPRSRVVDLWEAYGRTDTEIVITRFPRRRVSKAKAALGREYMDREAGTPYAWWRLGAHLFDWWVGYRLVGKEVTLARRVLFLDKFAICSWHTAKVKEEFFNYRYLGKDPEVVSPDDIADDCVRADCSVQWATSKQAVYDMVALSRGRNG